MNFLPALGFYISIVVILYISISVGLYMLNKKLWIVNPWLAWVPLWQFYSIVKCSWRSLWWIFLIFFMLLSYSFQWYFFSYLYYEMHFWWIIYNILSIASTIAWIAYIIIMYDISKRVWKWIWTSIWFILIPFIMFPLVGYKLNFKQVNTSKKSLEEVKKVEQNNEL